MRKMDRRGFVASLAGAGVMIASGAAVSQTPPPSNGATRFGFDDVVRRARDLATAPLAPSPAIPDALARLDNDAARDIKFRSERAFLAGADSRFRLQTIHLDPRSSRPVTVSLIRDGIATPIPYSANLFDYGRAKFERPLPLNLGFAGFRLRYPINDPRGFDDAVVFTGSSQFRFLGRGQRAGASLRALSVNAGLETEEFPFFREFWIEAPEANARHATIYALLDGESVTGAFQFQIEPGVDSVLTVGATLFPRRVGGVFGFAPVVSMYLAGEGDRRLGGDYRPEAHSSDALALHTGAGERVWRPLRNPARAARFSFLDNNPRGFGLVQRDRSFDHYQDLEAGYEARASYWVEPTGEWGEGRIDLIETPATEAGANNITAAWVSNAAREPGKPINIAWRVTSCLDADRAMPLGRVANTFQSSIGAPSENATTTAGTRRFLIDFSGGDLGYFAGDTGALEVIATANNGRVLSASVASNPHISGFRTTVDVEASPGQTADIRVYLKAGVKTLTETWTMPWTG